MAPTQVSPLEKFLVKSSNRPAVSGPYPRSFKLIATFLVSSVLSLNGRALSAEAFDSCPAVEAPGSTASCGDSTPVWALDREILLECIRLSRFNVQFHQTANKHSGWRSLRYSLLQEASTACSFTNGLIDLNQRIKGYNDTELKSTSALKRGEVCSLVGSCIGGSSSAMELAQNFFVDVRSRCQGYSPKDRVAYVVRTITKIDNLLAQRERLVQEAQMSEQDRQIRAVEGTLMKHVRNQLLTEFRKWSIFSQESMARENTSFAVDSLRNFAQVASSAVNLRAFQRPELDGGSAIINISAGVVAAFNPTVSWLVATQVRRRHRRLLDQALPDSTSKPHPAPFRWSEESELLTNTGFSLQDIKEAAFIAEQSEKQDELLGSETAKIEKLRRVAVQQTISAPIIGMTAVSRSICSLVGYYGYRQDSLTRNKIGLAGRISGLSGQSYSLVKTPAGQIHNFIYQRRLAAKGELPRQVQAKRLQLLEELEARVKTQQL